MRKRAEIDAEMYAAGRRMMDRPPGHRTKQAVYDLAVIRALMWASGIEDETPSESFARTFPPAHV